MTRHLRTWVRRARIVEHAPAITTGALGAAVAGLLAYGIGVLS